MQCSNPATLTATPFADTLDPVQIALNLMREKSLRIGVVQCSLGKGPPNNERKIIERTREAAAMGADLVVLPELFEHPYFPKRKDPRWRDVASPFEGHPGIERFAALARELRVVIPYSFYERDGKHAYNTVAIIDADGTVLGCYRKTHIPDGPGYEEKYYFDPGDTGFLVWPTAAGRLGVGICWDQWFPESARAMTLLGAEIIVYPTAIGAEPEEPENDTSAPWRRAMQGHAVANAIPIAAANRIGNEQGQEFYGCSFVTDHRGEIIADAGRDQERTVVIAVDTSEARGYRNRWRLLEDRRPDRYQTLTEREAKGT